MIKQLFIFVLTLIGTLNAISQDNKVLFTIDDTEVNVSEFEYIYNKNNFDNKADYSKKSLEEYLDLYVNFRLKVKEAEALGLDKDVKLLDELKVYQEQLYNSFYDKSVLENLIKEAQERSKTDVSVSHIFVSKVPDGSAEDNAEPRRKITAAFETLRSGADFGEVAKKYSDDKFSAANDGDLGYFTALQIAFYPMENAAYNTPVNNYSQPIETQIGFHIVKVNDIRPARGRVKTAILKLNKAKTPEEDKVVAEKIKLYYDKLKAGEDFAKMATAFSEDEATKNDGGELSWFGIAQYDPVFEDQAFSLKNVGDISEPFETSTAWYVIKLLGKEDVTKEPQDREKLIARIKKSDRYIMQKKAHVDAVVKRYGFELNRPNFNAFKEKATVQLANYNYRFDTPTPKTLFTIGDQVSTDKEFGNFITRNHQQYRRLVAEQKLFRLFDDFLEKRTIDFHIIKYGEENEEYGALLKEYRDGILLFDLMEKKVWSKAVEDTTGLEEYYEANKESFVSEEKAKVRKYNIGDNAKSAKLLAKILKLDTNLQNVKYLKKLEKKGVTTSFEDLVVNKSNEITKSISWNGRSSTVVKSDDGYTVYQVMQIIPAETKTFENAKGFAIAGYQDYLEKQWLEELRKKYTVNINEAVLNSLVKK